jgi:hypothetical protein
MIVHCKKNGLCVDRAVRPGIAFLLICLSRGERAISMVEKSSKNAYQSDSSIVIGSLANGLGLVRSLADLNQRIMVIHVSVSFT